MVRTFALYWNRKGQYDETSIAIIRFTYVLYGLNAERLRVKLGLCSFGSHTRTPDCNIASETGGLSTMYDIHACLDLCEMSANLVAKPKSNSDSPARLYLRS